MVETVVTMRMYLSLTTDKINMGSEKRLLAQSKLTSISYGQTLDYNDTVDEAI